MKISRSAYTAEFKELDVKRVKAGESIGATAQKLNSEVIGWSLKHHSDRGS